MPLRLEDGQTQLGTDRLPWNPASEGASMSAVHVPAADAPCAELPIGILVAVKPGTHARHWRVTGDARRPVLDTRPGGARSWRGDPRTSVQYKRAPAAADVSDFDQLVRASRLYYELGETQNAIAEQLGVTRPQVSRLLKRARAEGIVEIRIVDRVTAESPAGDALRRAYGLDAVHLAPTIQGPEDLTRRMVGRRAAQVLRDAVRDGMIVGIGDGASISAVADALDETPTTVSATVVPLAGGHWTAGHEREAFRRIADALGAQVVGLMSPGLVDDAATRRSLVAHAGVRAVLDLWDRLDLICFGIGGPAWSAVSVGEEVEHQLEAADAVGEVLIAPFDLAGSFVCDELRERVIAFDARRLGRVATSIGIGSGEAKVRPILGALRAGVVRTLVTDVATAEAVARLDAASRAATPAALR